MPPPMMGATQGMPMQPMMQMPMYNQPMVSSGFKQLSVSSRIKLIWFHCFFTSDGRTAYDATDVRTATWNATANEHETT